MRIFIVGPGGAGKSTSGPLLADRLGYTFVDLDEAFIARIAPISAFLKEHSYKSYARRNSALFEELLTEYPQKTVFALSSGFLVHDGLEALVVRHREMLGREGLPLLLLPSCSLAESERIIVQRQLARGLELNEEAERRKIRRRFPLYRRAVSRHLYSMDAPEAVASQMLELLQKECDF